MFLTNFMYLLITFAQPFLDWRPNCDTLSFVWWLRREISHLVRKSNQNFPNSWCIQLSNPSTSRIGYGFKKSILNFFRSRRSRSQSGSPPYGRLPVSLPPIERPKTMGSQVSARSGGSRTRETNNKPRSGKNEVQDYLVYKRTCIPKFTFSH